MESALCDLLDFVRVKRVEMVSTSRPRRLFYDRVQAVGEINPWAALLR